MAAAGLRTGRVPPPATASTGLSPALTGLLAAG